MHPLVGALLLLAATPGRAGAHGFGQRYDLPVPLALWVTGAAAAVAFSFVVIGLFVRGSPGTHGYPRANLLRWRLGRLLADTRLRLGAQGVAVGLLGVVVFAGFAGDQTPTRNFAPIWVWVVWWVGVAYVSALVGNLWAVVNPWAVLFGWAEALVRRLGGTGSHRPGATRGGSACGRPSSSSPRSRGPSSSTAGAPFPPNSPS